MMRLAMINTVTAQCRPHRTAVLLLLVLLAQQGTAQRAHRKRDASPAAYRTTFSCVGRAAGYYADISSGCQLYHMCDLEGRRFTHSCPNATLFQQRMMVCDHWYMVRCNSSELDYSANRLIGQRDKPFVSPEEHLLHREPVQISARQPNPGSPQGSLFADVTARNQKYHVAISSPVADRGRLDPGIIEQRYRPNGIPSAQDPTSNRKARTRNINTPRSQPSDPQTTTPSDSEFSVYFRTLPIAYTNNPFFQRYLSTITSPQPTIGDTLVSSELQSGTGQLPESITLSDESLVFGGATDISIRNTQTSSQQSLPSKSRDLATDLGIPDVENIPTSLTQQEVPGNVINKPLLHSLVRHTQASSQQSLPSKSRDLATDLGIPDVENIPTSLTQQEVPQNVINKPLLHSVVNTDEFPSPVSINGPKIGQKFPQTNVKFVENEENLDNTVELLVLDHRRMMYIPDAYEDVEGTDGYDSRRGNTTPASVPVLGESHVMHFRPSTEVTADHNVDCPSCYPGFLVPGTCHPCVIIR